MFWSPGYRAQWGSRYVDDYPRSVVAEYELSDRRSFARLTAGPQLDVPGTGEPSGATGEGSASADKGSVAFRHRPPDGAGSARLRRSTADDPSRTTFARGGAVCG